MTIARSRLAALAALAVLTVACGDDGSDPATTPANSTVTTPATAASGATSSGATSSGSATTTTRSAAATTTTAAATSAAAGKPNGWPADAVFITVNDVSGQNPIPATVISASGKEFVLGTPSGRAPANLHAATFNWAKQYGAPASCQSSSAPVCSGTLPSGQKFQTSAGPNQSQQSVTITFG